MHLTFFLFFLDSEPAACCLCCSPFDNFVIKLELKNRSWAKIGENGDTEQIRLKFNFESAVCIWSDQVKYFPCRGIWVFLFQKVGQNSSLIWLVLTYANIIHIPFVAFRTELHCSTTKNTKKFKISPYLKPWHWTLVGFQFRCRMMNGLVGWRVCQWCQHSNKRQGVSVQFYIIF